MKKESQPTKEKEAFAKLVEKRRALRQTRFGSTGSKTTNVKAARQLRREIARLLTGLQSGQ